MRDMFLAVLPDISVSDLTKALFIHLRQSDDIPTPKQLMEIIDPPEEPLSATLYIELKKKIREGYFPLSDEKQFMRAYESQEMAKVNTGNTYPRIAYETPQLEYED